MRERLKEEPDKISSRNTSNYDKK